MAADQPRPTTLNFITGNANKLKEVRAILGDVAGLELQSRDVAGAEIQGSIEEVARDKCTRAAAAVRILFFPFSYGILCGCLNMHISSSRYEGEDTGGRTFIEKGHPTGLVGTRRIGSY